jgi:hypothetical protein
VRKRSASGAGTSWTTRFTAILAAGSEVLFMLTPSVCFVRRITNEV